MIISFPLKAEQALSRHFKEDGYPVIMDDYLFFRTSKEEKCFSSKVLYLGFTYNSIELEFEEESYNLKLNY